MEFPSGSVNERYPEQDQTFNSSPITQYHDNVFGIIAPPTSHASLRQHNSTGVASVKPKIAFRVRSKVPNVGHGPRPSPSSSRDRSSYTRLPAPIKADPFPTLHPVSLIHRTVKSSYKQKILSSPPPVRSPNTLKHPSTSGKWLPGSRLPSLEIFPQANISTISYASTGIASGPSSSDHAPSDGLVRSTPDDQFTFSKHSFDADERPGLENALLYYGSPSAMIYRGSPLEPTSPASPTHTTTASEKYLSNEMMEYLVPRSEYELLEGLSSSLAETSAHHARMHLTRRPRAAVDPQVLALEEEILTETLLHLYEGGPIDQFRHPARQDPFDQPTHFSAFLSDEEVDNRLLEMYEGNTFMPDSDLDTALLALYEGVEYEEGRTINSRDDATRNHLPQGVSLQEIAPDIWSTFLPLTPPCHRLRRTYNNVPHTPAPNRLSRSSTV